MLPFMVMEMFEGYPGVPGLFVACVYSGSLSTVSSGINAMAAVTVEDLVKPFTDYKPYTYAIISKFSVVLYGFSSLGIAYLTSRLGAVLEAALSVFGIVGGPLVGLFTLGIIIPFANAVVSLIQDTKHIYIPSFLFYLQGSFIGTIFGLAFGIWVYIGSKQYPAGPEIIRRLPLETDCEYSCFVDSSLSNTTDYMTSPVSDFTTAIPTMTSNTTTSDDQPAIAGLYHISYLYLSCIGFGGTVGLGLIISLLSCEL